LHKAELGRISQLSKSQLLAAFHCMNVVSKVGLTLTIHVCVQMRNCIPEVLPSFDGNMRSVQTEQTAHLALLLPPLLLCPSGGAPSGLLQLRWWPVRTGPAQQHKWQQSIMC
jgi:hypothetical protein